MATNRVVFEVTDNGTLRALGAQASKAGQAMGNAAKGANTLDRNTKGAANASSNATKNFAKMAQGSNGLVAAYATLAANVFAVSAAFNFLKSAADFRVIQDAQVAFSSATGQGMQSLTRDLQTAAKGLLSFQDAAQAASIGVASGLGRDQIEALAKGAASASQILGRDVTDSFNRLVRGVTKAEPELLDELGITLRLADATEAYAATLGKRANELTQFERKQAVFNDVQGQLEEKFNRVADASEIEANAIDKLGKAFDRVLNNVKELSATLLEPVALFFAENVNALTAALGLLAIPLLKQILPGLDDWASTSKEAAKEAKTAYRASKKELEELAIAQKKITDPKASLAGAVSGVKSKSAGIQAIQAGGDLTERQRMSLLRAAEQGKGVVTQLSKDQQRVYIASLRAMGAENKKFGFSVRRTWESITTGGKRAFKTLEVAWKGAMTKMAAATAAFARLTDRLFRAAGIIGVVLLFIDLLKVALEKLGLIRKDKALQEMREAVGDLTERLKTNNQEFANFGKLAIENEGGKIAIQNFERLGNLLSSVTDNLLAMNEALENVGTASAAVIQGRGARKARGGGFMPGGSAAALSAAGRAPAATAKIDLGDLGVESREEAKKTLEVIRQGLESTGIDALAAGKEFKALVNTFITSGELTGKQAVRFAQLSKQIQSYGALSSKILQSEKDLNTQYNKVISSLTTYQTKYSDLIQSYEEQIERLKEMGQLEGAVAELLKSKEKQLELLLKLQDLEYKKVSDKQKLDLEVLKISRFATKNQKENIELLRQVDDLTNQISYIEAERAIIQNSQVKSDIERRNQLDRQLEILHKQRTAVEDQLNATTRLGMEMKNAFESGFQQGLAGLIKNEETNFKKIIFGIAENTLKAGADSLARTLTDKFMGKLFGKQTPEEKMKNAIVEGAREGAAILKAGVKQQVIGTTPGPEDLIGTSAQIGTTNLGTPVVDPKALNAQQPIFGGFLTKLKGIFTENTEGGFLSKLGGLFGGLGGIFQQLMGSLGGMFGGMTGGFGGILSSILPFSGGGIMNNGKKIPGYATGGIASGSGNGHLAMLHGTEAVVPLPNGKAIPVEGSTGNVNNVSITVNTEGNVQQTTQGGGEQGAALGKVIAAAVQSELQRQKRPGGLLSPYGAA
jgi:hypothetical protein